MARNTRFEQDSTAYPVPIVRDLFTKDIVGRQGNTITSVRRGKTPNE